MHGNFKKISGWALLLLAAAPLLIVTGFLAKQKYIQHQMEERLERSVLHTVTAAAADVVWINPGKEAEINGELFDVEDFHVNGSTVTLTGLYDKEESALKTKLTGLLKQKKGSTPPLHQLVFKFFAAAAVSDAPSNAALATTSLVFTSYTSYTDKLAEQVRSVSTPPPNA